jgi:hypothetical protein
MVEELQGILSQWIDKYSDYEINSSTDVVDQFQNMTIHEGDIIVGNNDTFLIENCQFNLTGKLIIKDMAEVIIRNATFISNWNTSEVPEKLGANPWRTRHIIVESQAKFTVLNSELIFSATYPWHREYHALILYDQATVNMTDSKITYVNGGGDCIYACNNSKLWIKGVMISTFRPENPPYTEYPYPKSGLVGSGRSEIKVQNSTLDEIGFGTALEKGNCTVYISNSNIEHLTSYDCSRVNMTDSAISYVKIYGNSNFWLTNTSIKEELLIQYSKVWLDGSSVKKISSVFKAEVWLHNSSVKEIHANQADVWIVWDWPLFGQVAVPYAWAPYIPFIALVIASIVIVTVFFLIRRKRRLRKGVLIEGQKENKKKGETK